MARIDSLDRTSSPGVREWRVGVELVLAAALITLSLVVLLQVGVIANIAMLLISSLTWLPLTLDPNAWYSGQSLMVLLLIAGLDT